MTDAEEPPAVKRELITEVALSAKTFWDLEFTSGLDAGDTSLRDPDTGHIYILPRPHPDRPFANWSQIGDDHVVVVDREGQRRARQRHAADRRAADASRRSTTPRPDVTAIVHSHGEWSQIFSVMRWDIPTYTSETYLVAGLGPIRCARPAGWPPMRSRGRRWQALGSRSKAALLPSHGAVCVGTTFEEAFHVAQMVERAARQATFIRLLGGAPQMTLHDLMSPESYQRMRGGRRRGG